MIRENENISAPIVQPPGCDTLAMEKWYVVPGLVPVVHSIWKITRPDGSTPFRVGVTGHEGDLIGQLGDVGFDSDPVRNRDVTNLARFFNQWAAIAHTIGPNYLTGIISTVLDLRGPALVSHLRIRFSEDQKLNNIPLRNWERMGQITMYPKIDPDKAPKFWEWRAPGALCCMMKVVAAHWIGNLFIDPPAGGLKP